MRRMHLFSPKYEEKDGRGSFKKVPIRLVLLSAVKKVPNPGWLKFPQSRKNEETQKSNHQVSLIFTLFYSFLLFFAPTAKMRRRQLK